MKNIVGIVISLLLSIGIVMGLPLIFDTNNIASQEYTLDSLVSQNVLSTSAKTVTYNMLYNQGQLVGAISDLDAFYSEIDDEYKKYEDSFPNTSLGLSDDLLLVKETGFNVYENKDDEIFK